MPQTKPNKQTDTNTRGKDKVKYLEKKKLRVYDPNYEQTGQKKWNVIALPLLGTSVLVLSVFLIIYGAVSDISDLIILGSLFLCGSMVFYALMYHNVCRPMCERNIVETYEFTESATTAQPLTGGRPASADSEFRGYDNVTFNLGESRRQATPTDTELYGDRTRQFLATPATTSGLQMFEETSGTPPPPRLALPSDPSSGDAVFTMDVEKEMAKHVREMSNLELL